MPLTPPLPSPVSARYLHCFYPHRILYFVNRYKNAILCFVGCQRWSGAIGKYRRTWNPGNASLIYLPLASLLFHVVLWNVTYGVVHRAFKPLKKRRIQKEAQLLRFLIILVQMNIAMNLKWHCFYTKLAV